MSARRTSPFRKLSFRISRGVFLISLLASLASGSVLAQPVSPAPAEDVSLNDLADGGAFSTNVPAPAVLKFNHREIAVFRTNLFGVPPAERVLTASYRIKKYFAEPGGGVVGLMREPQGIMITVDGRGVFGLAPGDLDPAANLTLEQAASNAVQRLQSVVRQEKEQRTLRGIILSIVSSVVMTGLLVLLFWIIHRGRGWLSLRLTHWASKSAGRISATSSHAYRRTFGELSDRTIMALSWILRLLLIWLWLTYVLEQFPLTRPVGDYFKEYLELISRKGLAELVRVVPDLLVVAVIFYITWFLVQIVRVVFNAIIEERAKVNWLDAHTGQTTQRIVTVLLWLLALVMAYPYLPGSGTQAFKAVTVFAGLLLSLGSSSVINQIASGLLLVYSRSLKPGEYIRVAETEGTVMSIGLMSTRVRTIKNETVYVPNTVMIGQSTINFSRPGAKQGVLLYTAVTISYAVPWRQVHELLKLAAKNTDGLLDEPEPFVLQTALSDFYVEYQINAVLKVPQDRVEVLARLHANIQDLFNQHGVQIMSPHYLADPPRPAVVPPDKWYAPPARPPQDGDKP
jgi:small-conductance mechanosensitive channel